MINDLAQRNELKLLQGKHRTFYITEEALSCMQQRKLPVGVLKKLQAHKGKYLANTVQLQTLPEKKGINGNKHQRIIKEEAVLGSMFHHNKKHDLAIISDGAGQFKVMSHGLCWVHAERQIHQLMPLNNTQGTEQEKVRKQAWHYFRKLKPDKKRPSARKAIELSATFGAIFTRETSFSTLNQLLQRLYKNKEALLLVLSRPEIALHTNGSKRDIRDYVKKRKISGGVRSNGGKTCQNTFTNLKKAVVN